MNAADVVAQLEGRYPCVQGPYRNRCQTGARYVVIGLEDWSRRGGENNDHLGKRMAGVVRETAPRCLYETEDEACKAFFMAFYGYESAWAAEPDGDPRRHTTRLYWRYDAPHIFWDAMVTKRGGVDVGALRARLVLSCAPVVEVSDADYDAARTAELERDLAKDIAHGQ